MKPSEYRIIMSTLAGSHLYGTATEESDIDTRGVFIPTKEYFLGCFKHVEQIENKKEDIVLYDIRKFCKLAADCNPNIIELLFVPIVPSKSKYYSVYSTHWHMIVENRDLFISKKARFTFSGYAISQLKRIRRHRSWLLDPPKKKPERKDFGLPEERLIVEKEQLGAYNALIERNAPIHASSNMLEALQKEKEYATAKREWKQFLNWKETRNPTRAKLEKRYGYDTKHAAHLYRLVTEGEELLTTGRITLPRPDSEIILKIRGGGFSYEQLLELVGNVDERFDEIYESSTLQHKPKIKEIDNLCIKIVEEDLNNINLL